MFNVDNYESFVQIQSEAETNPETDSLCPERFLGTLEGYPLYEKGFEPTVCDNEKKMSDLVTIIFDFTDDIYSNNFQETKDMLKATSSNFIGVKVVAITDNYEKFSGPKDPQISFIETKRKKS